jgi:hypothetical protein
MTTNPQPGPVPQSALNKYTTSEWGVRLVKVTNPDSTNNNIIRIVWNTWSGLTGNFSVSCKWLYATGNSNEAANEIIPIVKNVQFDTSKYKLSNQNSWAQVNFKTSDFMFETYYCDIIDISQDNNSDKLYVYTVKDSISGKSFTNFFVVPSKNTLSLTTYIGDNGVCFDTSQGYDCGNEGPVQYGNPGYALANKFTYFNFYRQECDNKYNITNYTNLNINASDLTYLYNGKNYILKNNTLENKNNILGLFTHVGDIVYGASIINFWKDYFKSMECIYSSVPSLHTLGNHEYYDGPSTCGSYIYLYKMLAMDYAMNLDGDLINNFYVINSDINLKISQSFNIQTSNWQYGVFDPLILNGYLNSYAGGETPYGGDTSFLNVSPVNDLFLDNINKVYYWHIPGAPSNAKLPSNYIAFWGHVHITEKVIGDDISLIHQFVVGGFGYLPDGDQYGWCELSQISKNTFNWKLYTWKPSDNPSYIGSSTTSFDGFPPKNFNTAPDLMGIHTFTKSKPPKPPTPNKTCCKFDEVYWCNINYKCKSDKSKKSNKSDKSDKSDKSKKSNKSDKSYKSKKSDKSDKSKNLR